jgi:hypothetical protein
MCWEIKPKASPAVSQTGTAKLDGWMRSAFGATAFRRGMTSSLLFAGFIFVFYFQYIFYCRFEERIRHHFFLSAGDDVITYVRGVFFFFPCCFEASALTAGLRMCTLCVCLCTCLRVRVY